MTPHAWITLATITIVVIALIHKKRIGPDLIMAGGLVILMISGVVKFEDAVSGFAQRPLLMIAGLFVVAAGLKETGGIELIGRKLLGSPTNLRTAQLRMMAPVAAMSAFMNTVLSPRPWHCWQQRSSVCFWPCCLHYPSPSAR